MKKTLLVAALIVAFILPTVALADGGIIGPPNFWMRETGQKAVIVFEKNTETLIISTTFEGDAKDFAWIVPTPSVPKVTKAPYNLFDSLDTLTQIQYYNTGVIAPMALNEKAAPTSAVTVIEQKKVDIYDITVLSATDKNALYDWLKQNNYYYPAAGKYILDDYISNDWIFTAIKINTESLTVAENQLRQGTANPLKLVFSTDKIIYPLKISSVTTVPPEDTTQTNPVPQTTTPTATVQDVTPVSPEQTSGGTATSPEIAPIPKPKIWIDPNPYVPIVLYVFADHKKEAIGFNTQWANWVKPDAIKKLAYDDTGNPWYNASNKLFLTKLSESVQVSAMKNDVFLVDASNNATIPPSNFWPTVLWTILAILIFLILPPALVYIILLLLFIFLKSRSAKIVFLVVQSIIALGMPLTLLLMVLSNPPYNQSDMATSNGMLIGGGIVSLMMILGVVLEIILAKRKKVL